MYCQCVSIASAVLGSLVTCPTHPWWFGSTPLLPLCLLDDISEGKTEGHFLTVIRLLDFL